MTKVSFITYKTLIKNNISHTVELKVKMQTMKKDRILILILIQRRENYRQVCCSQSLQLITSN